MNTLKIFNPATGEHIVDVPADDAASVAKKAAQARAAQPRYIYRSAAQRSVFRTGLVSADALGNARCGRARPGT